MAINQGPGRPRKDPSCKTVPVTGYFEPAMLDIIDRYTGKLGEARSAYVYRLVIKDLIDVGVLTPELAKSIRTGEPVL